MAHKQKKKISSHSLCLEHIHPFSVHVRCLVRLGELLCVRCNPLIMTLLQELLAGFKAEVVMCCKLNHPNVVQFYGYTTQPEVSLAALI